MSPQLKPVLVQVVDAAGRPVEGAFVTVEWGTAPVPEITQITDKTGRLSLQLPPGRFRIRAATKSLGESTFEIDSPGVEDSVIIKID